MKNSKKGVLWFLIYCLLFTILSSITKHLLDKYYLFEIIFIQTFLATLFLSPFAIKESKKYARPVILKWHAIRSFCWVLASAMYFYALTQISLPKAIAISFSVPLFTTLMAIIFLKEEIHLQRIVALIFGIIGMLVIIQPGVDNFEYATLWVIGAALLWSITDIIIKVLGKTIPPIIKTFYFTGFATIFSFPLTINNWIIPDFTNFIIFTILSLLFALNIVILSNAYKYADLTKIMPIKFIQLIFAAIFAYIFFNEIISFNTLMGALIIIIGNSYMVYREKKLYHKYLAQKLGKKMIEKEKGE